MSIKPHITFKQVDPHGPHVEARLGDGFVTPTVAGGWTITSRDRRVGISDWAGTDPVQLAIPIMFDGFRDNRSVEHKIHLLFKMMRDQVGKRDEPAVIELRGHMPVPYKNLRYVINGISPGDEIRRHHDGHRTRAAMTVSLLQYVPGGVVTDHKDSPAKRHNKGKHDHKHTHKYTVKKGDTIQSIAAKFLGHAKRWHEIAELNNLRDPKHLKVGKQLKIPRA